MGRQLFLIFVIVPVAVLMIAFAIANREPVRLTIDPFSPAESNLYLEAPLFLVLFAILALGILIGGLLTWFGQGKWRRAARDRGREAAELRNETGRLERELGKQEAEHSYAAHPPAQV